jgi:hypothetical protein
LGLAERRELQLRFAPVVAQLDNPGLARLDGVAHHQDDLADLNPSRSDLNRRVRNRRACPMCL